MLAHAADLALNDQASEASMANFTFVYDTTPPVGYLVQPDSGQVYSTLGTLSGTASDPAGRVRRQPEVRRQPRSTSRSATTPTRSAGTRHGQSFNVGCPNFFNLGVTGRQPVDVHERGAEHGSVVNGYPYTVTVQAVDNAGNVQNSYTVPSSSRTFTVDKDSPTAGFVQPIDGRSYKASALNGGFALNGTASDAEAGQYPGGDAISSGSVSIWYLQAGTSYYWNGSLVHLGRRRWSPARSGRPRSAPRGLERQIFSAATWITDTRYYAQVRMVDKALDVSGIPDGNQTSAFNQGQNLVSFIVDNTPPVSRVTDPTSSGFIQSLAGIAGTSNSDLSEANQYFFRVWYVVGASSVYWNGSAWNTGTPDAAVQLPIQVVGSTGTVAWFYPGTVPGQNTPDVTTRPDGTTYGLALQALDNAGNLETPTTVQVVLDRVGPLVSLTTPTATLSNNYYGTPGRPLPTISGTATDSPAGVGQVFVKINELNDGLIWNGSAFVSSFRVDVPRRGPRTNPWTLPGPAWIGNKQYQIFAHGVDLARQPFAPTERPEHVHLRRERAFDDDRGSGPDVLPSGPADGALRARAVDWFNGATEVNSGLSSRSSSPSATSSGTTGTARRYRPASSTARPRRRRPRDRIPRRGPIRRPIPPATSCRCSRTTSPTPCWPTRSTRRATPARTRRSRSCSTRWSRRRPS